MKEYRRLFIVVILFFLVVDSVLAQDDETRQATGLPMKIGENTAQGNRMNVSGRVTLEGSEKLKRRPVVTVLVSYSGVTAERTTTNDTGYFVVRNVPRENVTLVVEVDGTEVVRQPIIASAMGNPRFDFNIPWPTAVSAKTGVIYADQVYSRTGKSESLFQKAVATANAKDAAKAVELFNQILTNDPKDFVAWTELGTVFFKENSLDNAEACYFKAIELKKDYVVALLNLGKLYINRKQFDNAVLVLSNAVKSAPDMADAHQYLGEAYLQVKKGSSAVFHLREAIRLAPTEKAEIHLRLAALYDAAKIKDKAAAEYKIFLGKRPDYPEKTKLEKYIVDNTPR